MFYALVADIPNGGITNFFSQLITSFGYTAEQSLLYGTPGGVVEIVTLVVGGYLGDKLHNRILVSMFGLVTAIIGMALIVGLPLGNNSGRLGGYYLTQASAMPFVAFLSLIATNVVSAGECNVFLRRMLTLCYCEPGWIHQEDDSGSIVPYRLLRG